MKHCSAIDQPLRPSCRARWCSSWLARSSVGASAQNPQGECSKLLIIAIRLAVAGRAGDAHLPPGAGLRVETACRVHRQERPHPDFRQWWGRLVAVSTSAPGGTRTPNLLIRSQMLYPLSYGRTDPAGPESSIASHGGGRKSRPVLQGVMSPTAAVGPGWAPTPAGRSPWPPTGRSSTTRGAFEPVHLLPREWW